MEEPKTLMEILTEPDLRQVQKEAAEWTRYNFPNQPPMHPLIGVIEEIGELADCVRASLSQEDLEKYDSVLRLAGDVGQIAHHILKIEQGIRDRQIKRSEQRFNELKKESTEELIAKEKDSIGDIQVFLLNFCSGRNYNGMDLLNETWKEVKKRDWKLFPKNGLTK